jgi:hypothetical protein
MARHRKYPLKNLNKKMVLEPIKKRTKLIISLLSNLKDDIIFKGGRICHTSKSYFGIYKGAPKDLS